MSRAGDERDYEGDLLEGTLDARCYHVDGEPVDDKELVRRIQAGDKAAVPMLLSNNEKFLNGCAADVADRYGVYHLYADLKQEGTLAMLKAAEQFDLSCGVKFLTYAWSIVKAAILDYAAETTLPVRLPPSEYHRVRKTAWVLAVAPLGATEAELRETIKAQVGVSGKVAENLISWAKNIFDSNKLGDRTDYLSYGGDPAAHYSAKLRQKHIPELLAELTPRERIVVEKYCGFGEPDEVGMSFEKIAVQLNFNSPSSAEKAVHKARQEAQKPEEYSKPQETYQEANLVT